MAQKKTGTKKDGESNVKEIGLSIAAVAAAAAGLYYLYGKDGAKHRKQIKGWMLKAKGEVLEKMEKMKDINKEAYDAVVDSVMAKYNQMDVGDLTAELKSHWKNIQKHLSDSKGSAKKAGDSAKKAVKQTVKKAESKVPSKKAVKKAIAKKVAEAVD